MENRFNEALKQIDELNAQEQICPCCAIRQDIIETMIYEIFEVFRNNETTEDIIDELADLLNDAYTDIYDEGRRDTYIDIMGYANYNVEQIDGVEDDS